MSSLKLRKIAKIVKEINIDPSQTRYDIAGLTLGLCKFFYRTPQNLFQDLNIGDYTIDTSNNSQVLVIQNNELLRIMEAVQVCYILDITSSKYETDFNVDINQLKDEYNNLVDDVHALWDYIKKVGIVADDTSIPLILPQLNTDEVWVKTEDGYKGISLTDAEGIIKGVIEEYTSLMEKRLDAYVEDPLKPRLNEHVETVNKPELDRYVEETNKPALDDYTTQLEERLQTMIDQAVADKGLMPEGSDWLEIGLGNWLVVDLFNKNYIHYPPQLNSSDNAGVVKKDITDGGKSQVIRYYTTTGKMFFAVRVNEIWSEWQELGGQTDTMQFTQANHGFVFTAVTLDGATRKWVKANKYTSADGIAIKIDNDRFDVVTRGVVNIPTQARDDKGEPFVYDEYYFLSQEVDGGLSRTKNEIGTFQYLAHISEIDGKQVAYIDIGDSYDLDYEVVDTETADRVGIGTYKTTLRTADTIDDLKRLNLKVGDVVEVLGYYQAGDGANHKRKIENSDDGSGILLNNGLYANIVHNGEVNISWFGAKGDGVTDDTQAIQKSINYSCNNIFIPKGNHLVTSGIAVQNKKIKGEIGARITVNKNLQTYLFNVSDTIINNINIISNDYILYGFLCKNNVEVSKCYFEGRFGNCIRISEADSVIIDRCYVSENSEQTTTIYVGYSSNITISENIIKNHTGFGIQALVSNNVIFKNNSITQKYIEKEVTLNNNIPVEFTNDFNISRYTLELDGNFINCTLEKQDDTFILKEYSDVSGTAKFRGWTGLECLQANSGCDNVRIEKNFVYNSGDSGIVIGADYHYNGEKWVLQPESVVIGDYPKNIVVDGNMINGVVKASGIALNNTISAIVTNNNIKNVGYIANTAYRNGILIGQGYGRIVSGNITENIYGNIYGCVSSKGNSNNVGTNTENKDDIIGYNKGIGCKNLETFATSDPNRRRIGYRIIDANYDYSLNQYIKDFVDSKSTSFSSEFIKCSILGATGVRFNEKVTYAYPISIVPAPNEYLNLTFNKNILGIFENKIVKLDFYAKTENGNRVRLYYKPKNLNVEPSAEIQITSENWEKYSIQLAIGSIEEFFIRIGGSNDNNTTYISDLKLTLIEVE